MTKVFSTEDASLRRCSRNEVGQPWEDRWSMEDFIDDQCDEAQVGKPKASIEQSSEPADGSADILPDDMFDHEFDAYRRDPTSYKARNPPALVVKLLATCEDRRLRAAVKPVYAVESLSSKMIAKLSTDDLKRFVLHWTLRELPEEQQAEAIADLVKNASD